jgi:hypothetical protein
MVNASVSGVGCAEDSRFDSEIGRFLIPPTWGFGTHPHILPNRDIVVSSFGLGL